MTSENIKAPFYNKIQKYILAKYYIALIGIDYNRNKSELMEKGKIW